MTEAAVTEFTFNPERHEYAVAGKEVPGCTSVLASGGLVPYAMVAAETLERKGELGREVHKACHLHNINRLGSCDNAVGPYLESLIYFKRHLKSFELLSSEQQCIGWVNGMPYGMQIDCNAMVNGWDTIIEWKIGLVYPHHGVQLAGYAAGLPHSIRTPFARFLYRKRMVVQLRESGIPKVHEEFVAKSDYETFAALLYVSAWKKRFKSTYEEKLL